MLRIRRIQRQKLMRTGCAVLCVTAFMVAVLSVPAVAKALPDTVCSLLAAQVMKDEYARMFKEFSSQYVRPESYIQCVPISLSAVPGYDYEEETPPAIPDGVEFVSGRDLCGYTDTPTLLLSNRTNLNIDLNNIATDKLPFSFDTETDSPVVLILHTHGTESYLPKGVNYYTPDSTFRSTDITQNVVSVGKVLADALNAAGIPTVHDTTMYDEISYNAAYTNSRNAARRWIEQYPTIKCVIDLHRDAIVNADGENVKPVTDFAGVSTAQLMLVVGTDDAGANHPNWKTNLTFAAMLQKQANDTFPHLMRPVNLRQASFNQQLASGSFLLEVGSCANTVDEAQEAAKLFARIFIKVYYDQN
ncbi:MAG: stage II sporulation protein P [Clostridia bacterium]|nr:stage II sporulation protein P [Clostridia bacterium]